MYKIDKHYIDLFRRDRKKNCKINKKNQFYDIFHLLINVYLYYTDVPRVLDVIIFKYCTSFVLYDIIHFYYTSYVYLHQLHYNRFVSLHTRARC